MNEVLRRSRSTAAERALWRQRFLQSGLWLHEFATLHGLKFSTLQRWVASATGVPPGTQGGDPIHSPPAAPVFAEVTLPASLSAASSSPAWAAELVRPDGSTLRRAREVSAPLLKQLLRAG